MGTKEREEKFIMLAEKRVKSALNEIDYVIHTAAMKHVHIAENLSLIHI